MLHPVMELSREQMNFIKQNAKREALKRAMKTYKASKETDWVFREIVGGNGTSLGDGFFDLEMKTAQLANMQFWAQDAADITAQTLSDVATANYELGNKRFYAIYGIFDLSPEAGAIAGVGPATHYPQTGSCIANRLLRGTEVLAHWGTEHMYNYDLASMMAENPVIYEQKNKFSWKMVFSEGAEDKFCGLRGYVCEEDGDHFAIDKDIWKIISKDNAYGKHFVREDGEIEFMPGYISGGIDPVWELTPEETQRRKDITRIKVIEKAIAQNIVSDPSELRFREIIFGDGGGSPTYTVDLNSDTPQIASQVNFAQDAADLTAVNLSSVLDSAAAIPENKVLGIYGFEDLTPNPDLFAMSFHAGQAGLKNYWHVEHCYLRYPYGSGVGITDSPLVYGAKERIDWKLAFKSNLVDRNVALRGIVGELPGDYQSEATG